MINILFCVMNTSKKALGPLYDGTLCVIIVRGQRMNISYVDVRRDFARRTDRDATNSSRKYPYIATYPICLSFFAFFLL